MNYWAAPGMKDLDREKHIFDSIHGNTKLIFKEKPTDIIQSILEKTYLEFAIFTCQEIFNVKNIQNRSRKRIYTEARFCCWKLLKHILFMSYMSIGLAFNRDHSTIIHGIKIHENLFEYIPDYRYKYLQVKKLLTEKMIRDETSYKHLRNKS